MDKIKYKGVELDIDKQEQGQLKHNSLVKSTGEIITGEVDRRLAIHDKDKLQKLDVWARFQIVTKSGLKFGTTEYNELVKSLDVEHVLLTHRKTNPHHPEFFGGDFSKMSLVDLTELASDWYVANSYRVSAAKFKDMLDYQQSLYGFSNDVRSILENTFEFLDKKNGK